MEQKTKKILITTGIIGVLTLIAYKLLAKEKSSTSMSPLLDKTPLNIAPSIEDISIYDNTNQPNSSDAEVDTKTYTSAELADMLQMSFNGYGTNWSKGQTGGVVGVLLKLNSDEDFDNLNTAYGVRPINSGFLNIFKKDFVGNMNGAFNEELSKAEIEKVNEILATKGLTRRITIED